MTDSSGRGPEPVGEREVVVVRPSEAQEGDWSRSMHRADSPVAVVFDFDGTLVDTEWPIYQRAQAAFATFGVDLTEPAWASMIGHADGEDEAVWREMCGMLGADVRRADFDAAYALQRRIDADSVPLLPGVEALTSELQHAGIPMAIASSSGSDWIERHLSRLGVLDRFDAICGVDHPSVRAGKPAPDTYLAACADLGVEPSRSVALEDSGPGVVAATAAGLVTVVVPNRLTRHVDLSGARHRVADLTEVTLDRLRDLVAG